MKFWNFVENAESEIVELRIEGDIIADDEAWMYEFLDLETPLTSPKAFRDALSEHDGKELHVYIDTYGGDVFAGTSIYAELSRRNGKTVGIVDSKCMSAGTIIMMGCDEIEVSPSAIIMIHDPITSVYGGISDVEKTLELLNTVKESILNAYGAKAKVSREELAKLMREETYMTAQQAVELGFADRIRENTEGTVSNFAFNKAKVLNSAKDSIEQMENFIKKNQDEQRLKELELLIYTY